MRALVIDDKARETIAEVLKYASDHHYFPGACTPGDNPKHVARLGAFRSVFTYTHADGLVYRHLSVSIPGKKYPHPAALFMIAHHFGFTGWDESNPIEPANGWMVCINEADRCAIVVQPIGSDAASVTIC